MQQQQQKCHDAAHVAQQTLCKDNNHNVIACSWWVTWAHALNTCQRMPFMQHFGTNATHILQSFRKIYILNMCNLQHFYFLFLLLLLAETCHKSYWLVCGTFRAICSKPKYEIMGLNYKRRASEIIAGPQMLH